MNRPDHEFAESEFTDGFSLRIIHPKPYERKGVKGNARFDWSLPTDDSATFAASEIM